MVLPSLELNRPSRLALDTKPSASAPIGVASRTFADEGGKTPAQIWAERKAKERGETPPSQSAESTPIQSQASGQNEWKSSYAGKSWAPSKPPTRNPNSPSHPLTQGPLIKRKNPSLASAISAVNLPMIRPHHPHLRSRRPVAPFLYLAYPLDPSLSPSMTLSKLSPRPRSSLAPQLLPPHQYARAPPSELLCRWVKVLPTPTRSSALRPQLFPFKAFKRLFQTNGTLRKIRTTLAVLRPKPLHQSNLRADCAPKSNLIMKRPKTMKLSCVRASL